MPTDGFTPHPNITGNRSRCNSFSLEAMPSAERKRALMIQVYDGYVEVGPGGATRESVYLPMGIKTQTGHPICSELLRNKKLICTGRRGTSLLGRPAEILVADVHATSADLAADEKRRNRKYPSQSELSESEGA